MLKFKSLVFMSGLLITCGFPASAQYADSPLGRDAVPQKTEAATQAGNALKQEAGTAAKEALAAAPAVMEKTKIQPPAAAVEKKAAAVIEVSPQAAPSSLIVAEWEYFKANRESKDEDVMSLLLPQLADFVAHHPDSEYAGDAQLLKADFHLKLGDYKSAVTGLLRHTQEYPQSVTAVPARKLLNETIDKKIDKKTKPLLTEMAKNAESDDKAGKMAVLLEKMSAQAGEIFYDPLVNEYREFFNRFPGYPGNDELRLALADLHSKKQEYLPAKLAYQKMIQMCPASPLLARAKRSLGAVLAEKLKEYDDAIRVYQDITVSFPGTGEAWTAYGQLPKLSERQKKYGLAVETYEKIISLYPDKEEAYGAFKSEARILREEMEKPAEAVEVLNRLADKYKGEKALEALFLAADIARKDMKDPDAQIKTYDRIVSEYSSDPQAPKALFAAADVYEKEKKLENAREYYVKVIEKYAEDPLAKKAQKRLDSMAGK